MALVAASLCLVISLGLPAASGGTDAPFPLHAAVEVDPANWLLAGHSLRLSVAPVALPAVALAVESFSFDVPDLVTDLNDENIGWHVSWREGKSIGVEWTPFEPRKQLVVGLALAHVAFAYERDGVAPRSSQWALLPMLGWSFFPFGDSFFVKPWVGVFFPFLRTGTEGAFAQVVPGSWVPLDDGGAAGPFYEEAHLRELARINVGYAL